MSAITCLIGKAAKGLVDLNEANQIKVLYEKHYNELAEQVAEGGLESTTAAKTLAELMKNQEGLSQSLKSKLSNWGAQRMTAQKTLAVLNAQAGSKINKMVTTAQAKNSLVDHFGSIEDQINRKAAQGLAEHIDVREYGLDRINKHNYQKIRDYEEFVYREANGVQGNLMAPIKDQLSLIQPNKFGAYSKEVYTIENDILAAKYGQDTSEMAKSIHNSLTESIRASNNLLREAGFPIVDPNDARLPLSYNPKDVVKNKEMFKSLLSSGLDWDYLNKQVPETLGFSRDDLLEGLYRSINNQNFSTESSKKIPYSLMKRFLSFNDMDLEKQFKTQFGSGHIYEDIINYHNKVAMEYTARKRYGTDFDGVAREVFADKSEAEYAARFPKWMTGQYADMDPVFLTRVINTVVKPVLAVAQLGGTAIQAVVGDPVTAAASQALTWGVEKNKPIFDTATHLTNEVMSDFFKTFGSAFRSKEKLVTEASKIATMMEVFNDRIISESRNIEGLIPSKFGGYIYNGFSVLSLLQRITQQRQAHTVIGTGMHLADYVGRPLKEMAQGAQEDLRLLGVTDELWSKLSKEDLVQIRGANRTHDAVSVVKLWESGDNDKRKLAEALGGFINMEKERSVPTRSASVAATMSKTMKDNKILAVPLAATVQYAGWMNSVWRNTVMRMVNMFDGTFTGAGKALGAVTAFAIANIVMDGVYRQMMNIANLRDPEKMDTSFWGKSAFRATPVPYIGNYLSSDGKSSLGPIGSLFSSGKEIATTYVNKGTKAALMKTTDTLSAYVPGNNIWYMVGAYRNLIIPTLKKFLFGQDAVKELQKKAAKEHKRGTTRFYNPETGDLRAPDLSKAFDTTSHPKAPRGRPRKPKGL